MWWRKEAVVEEKLIPVRTKITLPNNVVNIYLSTHSRISSGGVLEIFSNGRFVAAFSDGEWRSIEIERPEYRPEVAVCA